MKAKRREPKVSTVFPEESMLELGLGRVWDIRISGGKQ